MDSVLVPVDSVSAGMLDFESCVELKTSIDETVSLFVDKKLIEVRADKSYLRAYAKNGSIAGATSVVLLPSETFETMNRWVNMAGVIAA